MSSPLLRIALAFVTGIILGNAFLYFPLTLAVSFAFILAAVGFAARRRPLSAAPLLFIAAAAVAGALAIVAARSVLPADHYLHTIPLDGRNRKVSGRIASPLERTPQRTAFVVEAERIDGQPASGALRVTVRDSETPVGFGDRISFSGRLFPSRGTSNPGGFDYPAHLVKQGIHGVVSIGRRDVLFVERRGTGILRLVQDLRERIRRSFLRTTNGDGSAVLQAMVLGEEGGLTDDLRGRFMAAGVTHILSISGSHLGLIAVLCFWACRQFLFLLPERWYHWLTLRLDPKKASAALTVLPVTFYALLAGGEVATVRALIMILAGISAVLLDRAGELLSALSLAALVTLVPDPQALFDISFQLSYLSVITIAFVADTWRRLHDPADRTVRRWAQRSILLFLISAAAAVATGPLVAFHFRQISPVGIAANMIAVPFAGAAVVPLGLFSGILSLFTGDIFLSSFNQTAADGFVGIVSFFAGLPYASVRVPAPGPLFLVSYAVFIPSAAIWFRSRIAARVRPLEFPSRPARWVPAATAISLSFLLLASFAPLFRRPVDRITFLDVGQGDCSIVRSRKGRTILIDGGGTRDGRFDVGRRIVIPYLADQGIGNIDLIILSHPHPDHVNGLLAVLREFQVRELWWAGLDRELPEYAALERAAGDRNISVHSVASGFSTVIDDVSLEVLHPGQSVPVRSGAAYAGENDRSLVIRLHVGGTKVLFPGDLHRSGEEDLLRRLADIQVDVLKVPHHGSRSSSSAAFVRAVAPGLAVISAGAGNPYRHPSPEVLERYRDAGAAVLRTDRDGAVLLWSGSKGWNVEGWSGLRLRTIDVLGAAGWRMTERKNWERIWIRTTGT